MGCSPHGSDSSRKNAWLLVVGCWLSVVGCRLSVVGCRLSVVGCRLSVVGCRLSVVVVVVVVVVVSVALLSNQKSKEFVENPSCRGVVFNGPLTRLFRSGSKAQYEKHHFVLFSLYSEMGEFRDTISHLQSFQISVSICKRLNM